MNIVFEKMNSITGNKLFFVAYLFFFAVVLLLCATADIFVPDKVIDTSYKAIRACDYPLIRFALIGVSLVHFAGGVAFFWKLCAEKLDW